MVRARNRLELNWDPMGAIEAIRSARPIADVRYAEDALDHYHRVHDIDDRAAGDNIGRVEAWTRGYWGFRR